MSLFEVFIESEIINNYCLKTKQNHISIYNKLIKNKNLDINKFNAEFAIKLLNSISKTETNEIISRVYGLLKNIDETAVLKKCYQNLRLTGIKKPKSELPAKHKDYKLIYSYNVFEILNILNNINGIEKYIYSGAVAISLYTGMHPGEILALYKDDIKNNYIYINRAVCSSSDAKNVIRRCKNDNSYRKIPIHKDLKPYIN